MYLAIYVQLITMLGLHILIGQVIRDDKLIPGYATLIFVAMLFVVMLLFISHPSARASFMRTDLMGIGVGYVGLLLLGVMMSSFCALIYRFLNEFCQRIAFLFVKTINVITILFIIGAYAYVVSLP